MIFNVPSLVEAGAWEELTSAALGGANWRGLRDPRGVDAIAVHHSVTNPTGNWRTETERIWQIHRENGWGGIGYNIIVTTEESNGYAKAVLIGDLASIRAHTPNSLGSFGLQKDLGNVYLIGICMVGQLHLTNPTDAQMRTMHEIVNELLYNENERFPLLGEWWDMHPHKAFDPTQCSGRWEEYQKGHIISPPPITPPAPPTTTTTTTSTTSTTTSTTTTTTTTTVKPEPPVDNEIIKFFTSLYYWLKEWFKGVK